MVTVRGMPRRWQESPAGYTVVADRGTLRWQECPDEFVIVTAPGTPLAGRNQTTGRSSVAACGTPLRPAAEG